MQGQSTGVQRNNVLLEIYLIIIPLPVKLGGTIGLHYVRPSVCLSVRPSVRLSYSFSAIFSYMHCHIELKFCI